MVGDAAGFGLKLFCGDRAHQSLADVERLIELLGEQCLVPAIHLNRLERQIDPMIAKPIELWPGLDRLQLAIDIELLGTTALGPVGQLGIGALAGDHQGGQQDQTLTAKVIADSAQDLAAALGLDRHLATGTVLDAELHIEQAQEMVDLSAGPDRALGSAAAAALLDRDRRRDADDGVDIGACRRLHELPRIGVERFQIAPLAFSEQDVEGEGALAAARDASDDDELAARDR